MATNDSLEKKVAQLFTVGFPGPTLDRRQLDLLSRVGVGGVILFARNYENVEQVVELTNAIQKAIVHDSYKESPAFISVDQEGGRVARLKAPFTQFPSHRILGDINSPKTCFEMGFVQARELRAAGVNVNFSPCLDVSQAMTSDAIGDRSFSGDINLVSSLGSALSRGLQKGGAISVIKHFPGHGAVSIDSHESMPICEKSVQELSDLDWSPFKRVIRARCEGVMSAHILYPKIDAEKIATFSRILIQEQLRGQMRFTKLLFTDDIEMGAVGGKHSIAEASFLAISAGCDHILLCHSWDQLEDAWRHLVQAFESGALPMVRLEESLQRIRDVKSRYLEPLKYADKEFALALIGNPEFAKIGNAVQGGKAVSEGPSDVTT